MRLTVSAIVATGLLATQGLYGQQKPDAARMHRDAVIVDAHNDVLATSVMRGRDIGKRITKGHTDLPRLKEGGVDAQFFAVFCSGKYGKGTAFAYANKQIDALMKVIRENPSAIALAVSAGDIPAINKQGKIAAFIGIEGGHMIESRIDYLDSLYRRGARYLTLTWNNSLDWASSAADESNPRSGIRKKGLSQLGEQIIRRMNELGMMIDLSHVGAQTVEEVLKISSKPVLVSHSNAYALAPHSRNLTDAQIRAVAQNGGVICLNFYSGFLDPGYYGRINTYYKQYVQSGDTVKRSSDEKFHQLPAVVREKLRPPLSVLLDHIDYMVKIAGIDHVGIGSDFDGVESTPKGLDDVSCYPILTAALQGRGYTGQDIRKIMGENVLRLMWEQERH